MHAHLKVPLNSGCVVHSLSADRTSPPSSNLYILMPQLQLPWDQLTVASYMDQLSLLMCFFKCFRPGYRLSVKCLYYIQQAGPAPPGVNHLLTAWWMDVSLDLSPRDALEIGRGRRTACAGRMSDSMFAPQHPKQWQRRRQQCDPQLGWRDTRRGTCMSDDWPEDTFIFCMLPHY